jgi:hypothetical protein
MKIIIRITMLAMSLLISSIVYCQFNMGINGSLHLSTASPEIKYFGKGIYATHKFGFIEEETKASYGIVFHKSFGKLFLLNEVNYRQSNATFHLENYSENTKVNVFINEKSSIINFPIIAGLNILNKIKIGAGTNFNYVLKSEDNISQMDLFEKKNNTIQAGMLLYGSYKLLDRALFSIKYEKMFSEVGDNYYFNNNTTRIGSRLDMISFGLSVFPGRLD